MKKQLALILSAGACVLLLLCLWQLVNLQTRITQLDSHLSSEITNTRYAVDNITNTINETRKQEASLLVDSGYSYGTPDLSTHTTVPATFTVTPKKVTPGVTTAEIVVEQENIPMVFQNGTFRATAAIKLFDEQRVSHVIFTEDGVQHTEPLNWDLLPYRAILPEVYASANTHIGGASKGTTKLYVDELTLSAFLNWNDSVATPSIVSIELVDYLNGQERSRYTLCKDNEIPMGEDRLQTSMSSDQTYVFPTNSTFDLYVEMIDDYGFHYQILVDHYTGEMHNQDITVLNQLTRILDDTGTILFQQY